MATWQQPKKHALPGTMRRVIGTFAPYWKRAMLVLLVILAISVLGLVSPLLTARIIDRALPTHDRWLLFELVVAMLAASIGAGLLSVGLSYLSTTMGQRVMRDLRVQLYAHLQAMSLRFYATARTGESLARLSNDVEGVETAVTSTLASVLRNVITVGTTVFVMLRLDWSLTLLSLALVPCFLYPIYRLGRVRRRMSAETQQAMSDVVTVLQETLSVSGALLIKSFGRQQDELARLTAANDRLMALQIRQTMIGRWFYLGFHVFFAAGPALLYLFGGEQTIGGTLSVGTLVAFVALQSRLFAPLKELLDVYGEVQADLALFDRIFAFLDLPVEIVDRPGAIRLERVRGHLRFRHVSFRYHPDQPTLDDVDFEARPGQLVALVGPSGAGKTTITQLVPRFYDVAQGSVEIDGHDVRNVKLDCLSRHVGLVTQDIHLWHGTIRDNLRYGRADATDEEVIAAATATQLHSWIAMLPAGYDTVVGEHGFKLSGGEKQRLAIARVLLKDPRIVILDEATSALDTQTERLVQAALQPLLAGRTVLAIAHRLSTILAADQILVIDAGRIVERGTHAELLALEGVYAGLYREQFDSRVASLQPGQPISRIAP